ncbi:hypothetical protein ACFQRB_18465 [Halobaculum litoreum]|uniref:Right handed beta helix region n=1 Tax=Halobaculum litoreum TaxID=3031998 RepID=A0ABD5XXT3_9EURY
MYLPAGDYRIADSVSIGGAERVGLVGDDATIVPSEGNDDTIVSFGWPQPVERALFAGITFDFTAENTGGRPLLSRADNMLVEDVAVDGEADVDQDLFRVDVTDAGGQGIVRRLFLPDGAPPDTKVTGCEVGDDTRGDVSFIDCEIDRFPDNGLYANPPKGTVRVIGGKYKNNGVAGVRVEVADDAVVRGVHVRCDDATNGGANMRGIRLRAGRSVLVEDCLVEMMEVTSSDGGSRSPPNSSRRPSATVWSASTPAGSTRSGSKAPQTTAPGRAVRLRRGHDHRGCGRRFGHRRRRPTRGHLPGHLPVPVRRRTRRYPRRQRGRRVRRLGGLRHGEPVRGERLRPPSAQRRRRGGIEASADVGPGPCSDGDLGSDVDAEEFTR